ncbi:hypothetical protein DEJ04_14010 [Curtobacterium sp. MCLR17_044]|nr:hypothetical protein DEJ04_14010 [Curtobacterium sp. MCLR17_044]
MIGVKQLADFRPGLLQFLISGEVLICDRHDDECTLLAMPNPLGVDFNARLLAAVKDVFTEVDAEPVPA